MSCNGDCANCPMKDACGSGKIPDVMVKAVQNVKDSLENMKFKILVLSGKGGVGKSTVTYLLSCKFAEEYQVGVLDVDVCGPSMPFLFGVENEGVHETGLGIEPCYAGENISLISTQFFLKDANESLRAQGHTKNTYVLQMLSDVVWSDSEVLIVDTPPGTSDEHLSIVSFMSGAGIDGAVMVTTPEEVAIADVRREIQFCRKANIRIIGVVENMSYFHCPECNSDSSVYPTTTGGAEALCQEYNLPLLGKLPIDPSLVAGFGGGDEHPLSDAVNEALDNIVTNIKNVILPLE